MGELWLALLSIDLVHDELSKMKNETANSNCNCNLQRGNNGAAARSQAGPARWRRRGRRRGRRKTET